MKDFRDKVVVVTGAASGIGFGLAQRFAEAGAKIVMADVEVSALAEATERIQDLTKAEVLSQVVDVSDAEQVMSLQAATVERFGAVHVLCNNAGVSGRGGPLIAQTQRDWKWVLGVNLWGVVHGLQAFLPGLLAQNEGHIVNTASIAGLISMPGLGPYNVSKHAVVTLSETLFGELSSKGSAVGVSVLCPGAVNTRIHDAGRNRPTELRDPAKPSTPEQKQRAQQARDMMAGLLAAGLAPLQVADQVLSAVQAGDFYILTHPEIKPLVEQRAQEIVQGRAPGELNGTQGPKS